MPFVNPFPNPYPAATPQLSYSNNFNPPTPGSDYQDSGAGSDDVVTGVASGYITFGCLVVNDGSVSTTLQGGIGQGVKHPTSQGDLNGGIVGVVMKTAAMESRRDAYPPSYMPGDPINIKRVGKIWTAVENGCAVHDPVYVRTVANSGNGCTQLGAFASAADSSNNINLSATLPIHWLTAQATPGGPAAIDFNFLGQ
jgi:hypothetical protein